ncbi:MAG: MbnP family protein [Chitinophagaceae bacterium]
MFSFFIGALLSLISATPDTSSSSIQHAPATAAISVEFDNIIGGKQVQLNTGQYTNVKGETFTISLLQYYISNLVFTKADGSQYVVPQDSSYFLIKEADPTTRYARVRVPEGEYTGLQFVLGVDSVRSTKDISERKGVLDPSDGMDNGMYWGWNSGYIFFKMEGNSNAAPTDPSGKSKYRYHIGGFGGYTAPTLNNIKVISMDLTKAGTAKAQDGHRSNIHIMVDVEKVFNGEEQLSIAAHPTVMFSPYSVKIANNFPAMFRHDHTENK